MKLINNNISPLPFYDDISLQNHRKDYAFGQIYPLITYRNMLLPFQVVIPGFEIFCKPSDDSFEKGSELSPSNIISDYIINADGSDRALPGYSIKEYAVKKGESYIIDIQNDFNDIFAIFTVCDTSGNAYYIQRGKPYFIKGEDKRNTINIAEDGLLRVSFSADGKTKVYTGPAIIREIRLYNFNTKKYIDITNSIKENGLVINNYINFSVIKYPGVLPIVEIKHEGLYYITMRIASVGTLYSEVFTVTNRVDDYLLLEYNNSYNFELKNGIVDFSDNFKFKCYLNTQVGKPEYDFEEEATERMGYTFIESQVSKKIYKFTFLAPEYLCDALRIVRLCENKQITSKTQTYDLTTFNMEPEWEDQGDLAAVECEFETDTVIANIGGYKPVKLGDFNIDYNNDFNVE